MIFFAWTASSKVPFDTPNIHNSSLMFMSLRQYSIALFLPIFGLPSNLSYGSAWNGWSGAYSWFVT